MEDGQDIVAEGKLEYYRDRGTISFKVTKVELYGEGMLNLLFEQLKKRLTEEGLFDPAKKKPISKHPKRVGIVTSKSGDAVDDIEKTAKKRNPYVELILYPVTVQGKDSAMEFARGIKTLDKMGVKNQTDKVDGYGHDHIFWRQCFYNYLTKVFRCSKPQSNQSTNNQPTTNAVTEQLLKVDVNGNTFYADFEDNSSAKALKEKLQAESITLEMEDYGGFEKVGDLPFSLPTNDENITTSAGDVILYRGNKLTIYYDTNTWNFTKVAKIRDADSSLKSKLGEGTVKATFTITEN